MNLFRRGLKCMVQQNKVMKNKKINKNNSNMDKMTIKNVSYQNKRFDNRRVLIYKNIIGRIKIITAYTCTVSLGFFFIIQT